MKGAAQPMAAEAPALPLAALLALATAGFITILTEALPAGLLAQMGRDLKISEALVGQFVTIYAIGSLLAAIPLVALTRNWRRRPLLQTAICGFFVVNTITALADNYLLILLARLFAQFPHLHAQQHRGIRIGIRSKSSCALQH